MIGKAAPGSPNNHRKGEEHTRMSNTRDDRAPYTLETVRPTKKDTAPVNTPILRRTGPSVFGRELHCQGGCIDLPRKHHTGRTHEMMHR